MPHNTWWHLLIAATIIVAAVSGFAVFFQWNAAGLLAGVGLAEEGELIMSLTLWLFVWAILAVVWLFVSAIFSCNATYGKYRSYALFMAFFAPWVIFGSVIVSRKWDEVDTFPEIFVYFTSIAAIAISYIGVGVAFSYPLLRDIQPSSQFAAAASPLQSLPLLSPADRSAARKFR